MPKIFSPRETVKNIFAVPVKNALGTIDIGNAITIMKFTGDELDYKVVAKNFLDEVNGSFDFGFCDVYSDEEIAYTQTRWAVIANIRTGKVISPVITYDLNDFITNIKSIDPSSRRFLIERETPDYDDYEKILHIIKVVDKDSVQDEGSITASPGQKGYTAPWFVQNKQIFTYSVKDNKLVCHDLNLRSVPHPFVEIFNRNSGNFRKLKDFRIHPKLPFGVVVEIGKDWDFEKVKDLPMQVFDSLDDIRHIHALYLLRWDTSDEKKQFVPILTDSLSLIPPVHASSYSGFQFSPDGSWMVFRDETHDSRKPVFTALPVDSAAPMFFGEPLFLGRLLRENAIPRLTAWTTDPLGFVVSAEEYGLYKWDLGRVDMARVVDTPKVVIPLE